MEVIGHRGYPSSYPENTIISFKKALECGADGIEMDIHLSRDNRQVVFHDFNLKRLTGNDIFIYDIISSNLRNYKINHTDEPIPLLDEVIEKFGNYKLFLELKTIDENGKFYYPSLPEMISTTIREFNLYDNVTVISFDPFALERMRKYDARIKLGLDFDSKSNIFFRDETLEKYAEKISLNYFLPEWNLLKDENFVKNEMPQDIPIYVWTVNDLSLMKNLHAKMEGIITDRCCEIKSKIN